MLGAAALPATATSMLHRNVADLIELSELIVLGKVVSVSDGFADGVPYTEVTLEVTEALKGDVAGLYTFRQFGLRSPRSLENGRTYLGVSPEGWPQFEAGEEVFLFLNREASQTGLRTTVGLFQGTFHRQRDGFVNGIGNRGLFRNLRIEAGLLTPAEEALLTTRSGPAPAEALVSFVRKAVENRWLERGRLQHVK